LVFSHEHLATLSMRQNYSAYYLAVGIRAQRYFNTGFLHYQLFTITTYHT
jgi:hypothetical protein